jgi:hypothetical protein
LITLFIVSPADKMSHRNQYVTYLCTTKLRKVIKWVKKCHFESDLSSLLD